MKTVKRKKKQLWKPKKKKKDFSSEETPALGQEVENHWEVCAIYRIYTRKVHEEESSR